MILWSSKRHLTQVKTPAYRMHSSVCLMLPSHIAKATRIDILTTFPLPGGPLVIPALNSLVQGINSTQSDSSFKRLQAWKVKVDMKVSFTWTGKNTVTTTHMWLDKLPTALHFKSGSVEVNKSLWLGLEKDLGHG